MKTKILVVEDESIIADDLQMILGNAGYQVLGPVDNGTEALEMLERDTPDLVLLDINIKGHLSGLDVAGGLSPEVPFIFITSYYDRATLDLAEKVNPSAYVVKPFRHEEVLINIRLALQKHLAVPPVAAQNKESNRIFLRDSGGLKPINTEELLYARGEDNYTRLTLQSGKEYMISQTLKNIEEKLVQPYFCRVHKSYLININYIDMIVGNSLEINRKAIPIGKTYRARLFQKMQVL